MNHWKSTLFVAALCIPVAPLARSQAAPADSPRAAPALAAASADRAFLGVYIGSENDGGGVKIDQVEDGSPAQKAGLQAGDVITALGDRTIGNEEELRAAIASHQVGEKLRVTFLRDGEKRRTSARLAKAPAEGESVQGDAQVERKPAEKSTKRAAPATEPKAQPKVEAGPPAGGGDGAPAYLGVRLAEDGQGRTTVTEVVEGSPAEKAGIKAGDVILAIDADETGSADDVVKLVQAHHAGDRVTVALERDGAGQKIKLKLGAKDAAAAAGLEPRGAGGGTIAVPTSPKAPEPPQPPPAGSQPTKLRGRVAAPSNADAAGADAVKKEFDRLRADLEKTRRELEDLRRKCEAQERTIEAVRRALGGGGDREPGSTSMAVSESTPGGDESAVISIPAGSMSVGPTEIAVAPMAAAGDDCCAEAAPAQAVAGDDCCAEAGTGKAAAGDCCEGCEAAKATGVGQIVVSDGDGDAQSFVLGEGHAIALKDGQLFFTGKPLTTKDFVIECEDGQEDGGAHDLSLDGQIEIQLDGDDVKQFHGQVHHGAHALTLKPAGATGTFEVVLDGNEGDQDGEECCEGCEGGEKAECCEEEEGGKWEEGGHTIVLQLADDGHGGSHVVHKAALGGATPTQVRKALKLAPVTKQIVVTKSSDAHDFVVKTDGGKGSCEGCCCCCEGEAAPAKIAFKAATGMRPPQGAAPKAVKPPARARAMAPGGMGGMPAMPKMPGMQRMPQMPGMPGGAHKVDNGGGMELLRLLQSGGTFTWRCDGPCELKVGPEGTEFHCEGSCEISRTGGPESVAAHPGAPAVFQLIGAGSGGEASESDDDDDFGSRDDGDDDEDDDDDDAPAARTVTGIRVL